MTLLAGNPHARHSFEIKETFEGGLVLTGGEAKSAHRGSVAIKGAFLTLRDGELWLRNAYFGPYTPAGKQAVAERRERKVLVHRHELGLLRMRHEAERLTMIPLALERKGRKIKLRFALARGKRAHEKRATIKDREVAREISRALKG